MAIIPSSTSTELSMEESRAQGTRSETGQDLLIQIANGPDIDMDMGGDLQLADPAVVGLPELSVSSRERVSGRTTPLQTLR